MDIANINMQLNSGSVEKATISMEFIIIKSDLGDWKYIRNIPHSGYDSEFFDGTLTIQIEKDGKAYAIRKRDKPPVKTENYIQPDGYPLSPVSE